MRVLVSWFSTVGRSDPERSMIRNRSAASKAANRSILEEGSVLNSNRLPSIGVKRKVHGTPAVDISMENRLINERLNKQQNKVEQEIRKYDEILKRNKNLKPHYDPKKKALYNKLVSNSENTNNHHNNSSVIEHSGKELIKIHGIKLDNRALDARRGPHGKGPHDKIFRGSPLPILPKVSSQPKGLIAGKYSRLH